MTVVELRAAFGRRPLGVPPVCDLPLPLPRVTSEYQYLGPLDGDDIVFHVQTKRSVKRAPRPPRY